MSVTDLQLRHIVCGVAVCAGGGEMPQYRPMSPRLVAEIPHARPSQTAGGGAVRAGGGSELREPETVTTALRTLGSVSEHATQKRPVRSILTMLLVAVLVALQLEVTMTRTVGPLLHHLVCHILPQSSSCTAP